MVPVWFQARRFQKEFGSRMALSITVGFLFFAFAWWSRDLLTDWLALLQVEGRLENAAVRLLAGEKPYLNFIFTDTPGAILLHALAYKLGLEARYLHLVAGSICVGITFYLSAAWGRFERVILFLLLLLWSFSLWNISHAAWPALALVLIGIFFLRSQHWLLAGLFFSLVFWFNQQLGLAAILGAWVYGLFRKEGGLLLLGPIIFILAPLGAAFLTNPAVVEAAFSQIRWLPPLPLRNLPGQVMGAPLVVLGLWVLSLYFFRANHKLRAFSVLAVLLYAAVGWMREGRGFLLGCFFLISLLAWVAAPLVAARETRENREALWSAWLPAAGFFFFFTGEFPPFLQLFPLAAFFLVWALKCLNASYRWLPRWWLFLPAFLLIAGGGVHQARLLFLKAYASRDAIGRRSYGEVSQVGRELAAVKEYLLMQETEGRILVLPSAPYVYFFSGLRNPTPFDEAQGEDLGLSLAYFLRSGGRYLVIVGEPASSLSGEIREKFSLAQSFGHFSVWRLNGNGN